MVLSGRFFLFGGVSDRSFPASGFGRFPFRKSRTGHRPAGCGFQLFGRFFDFSGLSRSRRPLPSGTAGFRVTRRPFRSAGRISVRETGFRIAGMPSGSSWRFFRFSGVVPVCSGTGPDCRGGVPVCLGLPACSWGAAVAAAFRRFRTSLYVKRPPDMSGSLFTSRIRDLNSGPLHYE